MVCVGGSVVFLVLAALLFLDTYIKELLMPPPEYSEERKRESEYSEERKRGKDEAIHVDVDVSRLPPSDYYGVYWLGHPHSGDCPAILPIQTKGYDKGSTGREKGGKSCEEEGTLYFASLGPKGVLWDDKDRCKFRVFDTPHKALVEIRKRLVR